MLASIQSKIFCVPVSLSKNLKIKIYKTVILSVVLYGRETWSLHFGGGTQTEGFWEQSVEDIWT
jgi:hypothetical protein